jgi:flagellar motor switch protein FliM
MEPMQGWVTCDLSMPLALASLNRFQDPDELEQEVEMRSHIATDLLSITPYHIGLVNELIKFIIIKLEDVWSPILPIKVQNINIETVPRLILKNAELTNAEEAVMQIDMDVKVPRFKGLVMSLCYPVFMLEETLPQS